MGQEYLVIFNLVPADKNFVPTTEQFQAIIQLYKDEGLIKNIKEEQENKKYTKNNISNLGIGEYLVIYMKPTDEFFNYTLLEGFIDFIFGGPQDTFHKDTLSLWVGRNNDSKLETCLLEIVFYDPIHSGLSNDEILKYNEFHEEISATFSTMLVQTDIINKLCEIINGNIRHFTKKNCGGETYTLSKSYYDSRTDFCSEVELLRKRGRD